jgi:hypothetical protein
MQREPMVEKTAGRPPPERFRTPESYIHWDRGMAIVAGMIGIVLVFLLLIALLPIRESGGSGPLTGLATPEATVPAATVAPAARVGATAAPPPTGPDQPRLSATVNERPFVRRGAGINFAALTNLQPGQRVEVVGRSPDRQWYQIVLPDNARERGWVSQEFLAVEGDVNTLPEVSQ